MPPSPDPSASPGGPSVFPLAGGCLCGGVRYEISGKPFHETVCHCRTCRRSAGAPMVAWFSVMPGEFNIVHGALRWHRSSQKAQRAFCPACGTQLVYKMDGAQDLDVTTASLDEPEAVAPLDHTFTSAQLSWVKLGDGLPRYEETRDR